MRSKRKLHEPAVKIVEVPYWPQSWVGWRFTADECLLSPHGERFTRQRLEGLAWRLAAEERRDAAKARAAARKRPGSSPVTVIRIRNNDWHREWFGTAAG